MRYAAGFVLLLCGCVTAPPTIAIKPTVYRCISVTPLTPQQNEEFLREYSALPPDGILHFALQDWYRMRQDARSCTNLTGE